MCIRDRLVITQPPEGMHFGFSRKKDESDKFEKRVRSLKDGKLLEGESALADVVLQDSGNRVVNLSATVANIRDALGEGDINSALTALEMIPVSYTHLDVYKRQVCFQNRLLLMWRGFPLWSGIQSEAKY